MASNQREKNTVAYSHSEGEIRAGENKLEGVFFHIILKSTAVVI